MLRPQDPRLLRRLIEAYRDAQRQRADALSDLLVKANNRLEAVAGELYLADVVDPLPASAPRGKLLVTPGDIHLYVGTGMATPLRRIPTQALP